MAEMSPSQVFNLYDLVLKINYAIRIGSNIERPFYISICISLINIDSLIYQHIYFNLLNTKS